MAALDVFGRRGALRLIWELRERGQLTFRALQEACETNPGLLNARLKELRELAIVDHAEGVTSSPSHGRRLAKSLQPLGRWAADWAADLDGAADVPRSGRP